MSSPDIKLSIAPPDTTKSFLSVKLSQITYTQSGN